MNKISWKFSVVVLLTWALSASAIRINENEATSRNAVYAQLFLDTVAEIYQDNFNNLQKVLDLANLSGNIDFKAVILATLYEVMKATNHTLSPLRAIPLYNEIDHLLNKNDNKLLRSGELEEIRQNLLLNTIIPIGADILRAAVYVNSHQYENNTVSELLDLLNESSNTVSDETISRMVDDVYNIVPTEQLVPLFANLSKNVLQNVYAMVALAKKEKFKGTLQLEYYTYLRELTLRPEYESSVPTKVQRKVNAIIPTDAGALLSGNVCIYRQVPNDKKLYYMQRCGTNDQRACITKNVTAGSDSIIFRPERQESKLFRFQNIESDAYLNIRSYFQEDQNGIAVNFFAESIREVDKDLLIQFESNTVALSDMNSTMYICSGNLLADEKDVFLTHTINANKYELYKKDCRWNFKKC